MLAVAAVVGLILKSNQVKPNAVVKEQNETFQFYKPELQKLSNAEDTGVMIMDCDDESDFASITNATVTHKTGKYVQGTGALKLGSIVSRGGTRAAHVKFDDVDISEYKSGSIHFSIYVSDIEKMSDDKFNVEITSSGTWDMEEMSWWISPTILDSGWNDVYLSIADATVNKEKGEPDFENINFCRILAGGGKSGLEFAIDNVYATNTKGDALEDAGKARLASSKGRYFMDCDTLDGLSIEDSANYSTLVITSAKGEYKEGKGALGVMSPKGTWVEAKLKPFDLSAYQDGVLSFWLYVDDVSYINKGKFVLELTSSGTFDKNELTWVYDGAALKNGWNEIVFSIARGGKGSEDPIDLTKVNFMRIYGSKCEKGLNLILDGFQVRDADVVKPKDGVLLSCDNLDRISAKSNNTFSITTTAGEYKEGTGAFKSVGSDAEFFRVGFYEKYDLTEYEEGALHLWLYVDDVSKLGDILSLELGSGGKPDVDEYQWQIQQAELENGWNELTLEFGRALKLGGTVELGKINCMRLFAAKCKSQVTVIMDDVRVVQIEKQVITPQDGMLLNCDSLNRVTVSSDGTFSIVKTAGQFVEGTGAYRCAGTDDRLFQIAFRDYYDLSAYKDGGIEMQLWIDDVSKLGSVLSVELGSGGKPDVNEYQWQVNTAGLKNGWNKLSLRFSRAMKLGGTPDISRINAMRIFSAKCTGEITALLDNVRAVNFESKTIVPEDGLFLSCDNMNDLTISSKGELTVTNVGGEFKEGTGAYKVVGAADTFFQMTFDNKYDISAYKYGGLHLWLYVDDTTKLGKWLVVELGSGGKPDVNEYQWAIEPSILTSGWNEILLRFDNATEIAGGADLEAINVMRIYSANSKEVTVILDDMRAVNVEIQPENPVEPQTGWRLDTNIDNLVKADGNENIQGLDEGTTYLKTQTYDDTSEDTQKATKLTATSNKLNLDFTGYCMADLKLTFRVYNAGTEGKIAEGGSIRLSNNESNKQYATLLYAANKIKINGNGWTKVEIPLSDAGWSYHNESGQPDTKFDLSAGIHSFSFDNWKCTGEYYICDIQIEEQSPEWNLDSEIVAQKTKNNNQADTFLTATGSESFLEAGKTYFKTTDYTESASTWSLKATGLNNPFGDKYSNENLKLTFMVYSASEQTNMTSGGTIRLGNSDCGSSGTWVVKPADISLKQGWNKVELPLKDSDLGWFAFDWSQKIVAVSFDGWKCNDVYYICNIKLVPITTSEWNLDSSLEKKTNVEEYVGTSEDAWAEAGKTYLKTTQYDSTNDTATKSTIKTEKLDLDFGTYTLEDLKLTFRVYNPGESTTLATGGSIRLGNTNCGNDGTLWYIVANKISVTPNGWTTVEVPLSEWENLNVSSTTTLFDWTAGIKAFTFDNLKCSDEFYICDIKLVTVD